MKYHPECVDRRKNNESFGHVHGKVSDNIITNLLIPEHIQNRDSYVRLTKPYQSTQMIRVHTDEQP